MHILSTFADLMARAFAQTELRRRQRGHQIGPGRPGIVVGGLVRHVVHRVGVDRRTGRPITAQVPVYEGCDKRTAAALLRDYDIRKIGAKTRAKMDRADAAHRRELLRQSGAFVP